MHFRNVLNLFKFECNEDILDDCSQFDLRTHYSYWNGTEFDYPFWFTKDLYKILENVDPLTTGTNDIVGGCFGKENEQIDINGCWGNYRDFAAGSGLFLPNPRNRKNETSNQLNTIFMKYNGSLDNINLKKAMAKGNI
jgi:hypothetical protein